MFKLGKLKNISNENVKVNLVTQEKNKYKDGKRMPSEVFKTLSFNVSGDDYSFEFSLNCKLEKLLEIPMDKTVDFKDYILLGGSYLNIKGLNSIDPQMNIVITRYLKNKFIIFLTFYTEYGCDKSDYFGKIEIVFNLDDYLDIDK